MATAPEPTRAEQARPAPERREPTREDQPPRAAALPLVRTYGDPVLRTPARPVPAVDAAVAAQIRAMMQLLDDALEAALAAPPRGVCNRVFVDRPEGEDGRLGPVRALVNPEREWAGGETAVVE